MIVAFSTFRYSKFAYTVGAVFEYWSSPKPKYYLTSRRLTQEGISTIEYIMECLKMVNQYDISYIIIDGYVWTTSNGKDVNKGFGKLLQEEISKKWITNPTVIGIASQEFPKQIPYSVEIKRGIEEKGSLWVTSSEYFLTESDAKLVSRMHGDGVIPTIIKCVKDKAKEFLGREDEINN